MSFDDIAIDDGCVARLELWRNLIAAFHLGQVLDILHLYGITVVFHVVDPVTTAASGRRPEDGDLGLSLLARGGGGTSGRQQDHQKCQD
jgi:hypothetical protein